MILYEFLIGMHWHWMVGTLAASTIIVGLIVMILIMLYRTMNRYIRTGSVNAPDPYSRYYRDEKEELLKTTYADVKKYNPYLDKDLEDTFFTVAVPWAAGAISVFLAWEVMIIVGALYLHITHSRKQQMVIDRLK